MAAQDEPDTRTDVQVKEDAMRVLIEVVGGDEVGNITKALEFNKIKDPSLPLARHHLLLLDLVFLCQKV